MPLRTPLPSMRSPAATATAAPGAQAACSLCGEVVALKVYLKARKRACGALAREAPWTCRAPLAHAQDKLTPNNVQQVHREMRIHGCAPQPPRHVRPAQRGRVFASVPVGHPTAPGPGLRAAGACNTATC